MNTAIPDLRHAPKVYELNPWFVRSAVQNCTLRRPLFFCSLEREEQVMKPEIQTGIS